MITIEKDLDFRISRIKSAQAQNKAADNKRTSQKHGYKKSFHPASVLEAPSANISSKAVPDKTYSAIPTGRTYPKTMLPYMMSSKIAPALQAPAFKTNGFALIEVLLGLMAVCLAAWILYATSMVYRKAESVHVDQTIETASFPS